MFFDSLGIIFLLYLVYKVISLLKFWSCEKHEVLNSDILQNNTFDSKNFPRYLVSKSGVWLQFYVWIVDNPKANIFLVHGFREHTLRCFDDLCLSNLNGHWIGIPLDLILLLYSFVGLAIVCDDYLVKGLEVFCDRWYIREDIAGASFMAFGSAAPEIVISCITTIQGADAVALGMGSILGSALIAFLFIPGGCGLNMRVSALDIKRRPLLRDIFFYIASLVLLLMILSEKDSEMNTDDSLFLIGLYMVYILTLIFSPMIRQWYRVNYLGKAIRRQRSFINPKDGDEEKGAPLLDDQDSKTTESNSDDDTSPKQPAEMIVDNGDTDNDDDNTPPKHPISRAFYYLVKYPFNILYRYTIFDCEAKSKYERFYPITIIISIIYISIYSFVIVAVINNMVSLTDVSHEFFGVTLVALAAQIPDSIQSFLVAKRGYGSMAVSNALGSQVCNILVGLGLPYLISNIAGKPIPFGQNHYLFLYAFLVITAALILSVLLLGIALIQRTNKAKLTRFKSYILIFSYIIFIVIIALFQFAHLKSFLVR